tara:strand:+ start:1326 stop:1730 length:405 start_codon:yes stop_codon:yes gene_type:complete
MKTSTIKTIQGTGTYSNGHSEFNKFQVSFANGDLCNFLAKGEFKKAVGDLCDYEITNEKYNSAKVIYPKVEESSGEVTKTLQEIRKDPNQKDPNQIIVRQSMTKASVDFHTNRKGSDILDVMADAQILINFINE